MYNQHQCYQIDRQIDPYKCTIFIYGTTSASLPASRAASLLSASARANLHLGSSRWRAYWGFQVASLAKPEIMSLTNGSPESTSEKYPMYSPL